MADRKLADVGDPRADLPPPVSEGRGRRARGQAMIDAFAHGKFCEVWATKRKRGVYEKPAFVSSFFLVRLRLSLKAWSAEGF